MDPSEDSVCSALIVAASCSRWIHFLRWQLLFPTEVHFDHDFLPNILMRY
jgi:hypothetical protein